MEPRQGGRFHIWHILGPGRAFPHLAYIRTREMPFCNLCASKDGTFERENCAPKRPARFRGLDLASAISSSPENHYSAVLDGSADVYTGKASEFVDKMNSKTRELCSDRDTTAQFQKTKQTKTPVAMGRGY